MYTNDANKINDSLNQYWKINTSSTHFFSAPSNIALVKYWGKKEGRQLPANPSFSFTLSKCITKTKVKISEGKGISFKFHNENRPDFLPKIENCIKELSLYWIWPEKVHLEIESENNFPHAAGIASSASGFAAFASCLTQFHQQLKDNTDFNTNASFASRLGSGSACRSIFDYAAIWGEDSTLCSKDEYAIGHDQFHSCFKNYKDSILIISSEEKKVSSRAGHSLMNGHPFAKSRFIQAKENISKLMTIMDSGDLEGFVNLVEEEALSLHAMMMTGKPSYTLMSPNTLRAIEVVRSFRNKTQIPICFTLDAGPNLHLLYPENVECRVHSFIEEELRHLCDNKRVIHDELGLGVQDLLV